MRSSIIASKTKAPVATAEAVHPGGWNGHRLGIASEPPRIVRAEPEHGLEAARGIGVGLIVGGCLWLGLAWVAIAVLTRFQ
jgi:hypothetical protein